MIEWFSITHLKAHSDAKQSAFIIQGNIPLAIRLAYHIVILLPLVGGVSYEILKFSGKNINHPLVKILTVPGMALQKITTQPPDDSMVEVGLVAMKAALGMDLDEHNVHIIQDVTWRKTQ